MKAAALKATFQFTDAVSQQQLDDFYELVTHNNSGIGCAIISAFASPKFNNNKRVITFLLQCLAGCKSTTRIAILDVLSLIGLEQENVLTTLEDMLIKSSAKPRVLSKIAEVLGDPRLKNNSNLIAKLVSAIEAETDRTVQVSIGTKLT